MVTLGEGWTPLLPAPRYGAAVGVPELMVKDEGLLPTGSFKARGAAVGVSRAAELGVRHIAMPTNGNAGAAWATYAARAGHAGHHRDADGRAGHHPAGVPDRRGRPAPGRRPHRRRRRADPVAARREPPDIFDASTLKEPYRIEGKKTMGLEIAEQLGWWLPDVIVYPTGGGVGLIGIHKGLSELRTLGWIPDRPLPRLVAVQSTGCAPVVRAFDAGATRCEPWADPSTVAFGIQVPAPLGDELILAALADTDGTAIAVDDAEILADLAAFGRHEGLLLCPEGAAALTAVRQLRRSGWLSADDRVVVAQHRRRHQVPPPLALIMKLTS